MLASYRVILMFFLSVILLSCASINRQTRLVQNEADFKEYWINREYALSELPIIKLWSSCVDEQRALVGPFIGIPLPVIPNFSYPFEYAKYKKRHAVFSLSIKTPPKMLDWDKVIIQASLNGESLVIDHVTENSDVWAEHRMYRFKSQRTCGEIEGGEIAVQIDGVPESIKSTIFLKHRWRIDTSI